MKIKSNLVKVTAAAALSITGIATVNAVNSNMTAHVQAATEKIRINYIAGYGVNIWTNYNHGYFTGKRAAHGSTWNVLSTAVDKKGITWYQVGENQWISGQYAIKINNSIQKSNVNTINNLKKNNTKKSVQADDDASGLITLAKSEVGKSYVWGATGPSSFDCSGLVQYLYKNATGVSLPRTTYQQVKVGQTVSMSNLQPGDLLFWGSASAPYHVGIYVGNGQYIHAATPGQGVVMQTLSSYFYPSVAKRVLN